MFYLIGLGLGDPKDITVRGLEAVRKCNKVYLEAYTSFISGGPNVEALENFLQTKIFLADRKTVEQNSGIFFENAHTDNVCLLVAGDPFGATTHCDLLLRAKEQGIKICVIHNTSILTAVGCCGLQLYSFGETISIVLWTSTWCPDSYFDKIISNMERGLHTLCLLDIKVKEQSIENLMRGKDIFEPPYYMTCGEAAQQLIESIQKRSQLGQTFPLDLNSICVGLARVGWGESQKIVSATLAEMCNIDMGPPLHSLIIPGKLHPLEEEMLQLWKYTDRVVE